MVGSPKVIFLIKYKIKEFERFKNLTGLRGPVTLCISRELTVEPEGKIEIKLNKKKGIFDIPDNKKNTFYNPINIRVIHFQPYHS